MQCFMTHLLINFKLSGNPRRECNHQAVGLGRPVFRRRIIKICYTAPATLFPNSGKREDAGATHPIGVRPQPPNQVEG